eukprot:TRINITY_DN9529_c0_g1_i1.p1 TRINITY_DN9529_c0_g1~~TRINITY_DN9529_c0_g1_i1.p1  ORF type:complete len:446 (+),score=80.92 TRINITY_DN9529_c0_g1_i1:60-1340(+)
MDDEDTLKHTRSWFHIPKKDDVKEKACHKLEGDSIYLCGNSLGLQPMSTEKLLLEELDKWKRIGVKGHFQEQRPWLTIDETLLPQMAKIVGAEEVEVAVMGSLSTNIHLMMVPFYTPTTERHKIIIEHGAFPSDWYIAGSQVDFHGFSEDKSLIQLKPREGEHCLRDEDIVASIKEHGSELALVMLPGIQYYTGQLMDMAGITKVAHEVGAKAGFDLAHAVGNVELQLHEWNVDFACWCSYKYLNSGPGGIGGIFVHSKYADGKNLKRFAGWWGHDLKTRFKMEDPFSPMPGAFGYRHSNPSVLTTVSLLSSLNIFDSVGMKALCQKSKKLTGYLEYMLVHLLKDQIQIITPQDKNKRGCQLSLKFIGENEISAKEIEERLFDRGVVCDVRGKIIRAAPTPLYNTYSDVYHFVHILKDVLSSTTTH